MNKIFSPKQTPIRQQRGVALITAMLVVSIATVTAVALSSRQGLDVRRTANVLESDQAYLYALGIESVAKELLLQYTKQGPKYDDPELLFVPYTYPVENGTVSGSLLDLEGRFNVNNLVDDKGKPVPLAGERFRRLISIVADQLRLSISAEALVNATLDWLDEDQELRFPGAEDSEYLAKLPPYRAANRMLSSTSELALIEGFTPELLNGATIEDEQVPGLLEYVSALPEHYSTINPNSANKLVLQALSGYLDARVVEQMLASRPFKSVSDFTEHTEIKNIKDGLKNNNTQKTSFENDLQGLDVQSSYFMIRATTQVGKITLLYNSIIYRDTGGRSELLTVSRAFGTDGI
ncbi:MAG: type II secretion system minor pseudopilin GspK [Gammaproteobacteria bacterium]|nr:type II secretion system minor pseudopilin GspK [Gammaproteobacteria bacterium]